MDQFDTAVAELERRYAMKLGEAKAVRDQIRDVTERLDDLETETLELDAVIAVLNRLSESTQQAYLQSIQRLVSEGLRAVFGEPFELVIVQEVRANRPVIDFRLRNPDGLETDLLDSRGGGMLAVVGVLLRFVMVRLLRDRTRQLLVLDEPFAHLSDEYVGPASELVARLSRELGVQVIMVTHQPETLDYADKSYRFTRTAAGVTAA